MNQERSRKFLAEAGQLGILAGILAIAFLNVSFPKSEFGYEIKDENDLEELSPPEERLAKKLMNLGLAISHELRQIKLDVGVQTARKFKNTDKFKDKNLTSPDFYFHYQGIDCFLEVGSHRQNAHKRRQQSVVEEAVTFKHGKKILYLQLFKDDIDFVCQNIGSAEDLINYLYSHPQAVFASAN